MKNKHGIVVIESGKPKTKLSTDDCSCGQTQYGFDCVCNFVAMNKGNNEYSCEYCGLYEAIKARCNKCEMIGS